MASSDALPTVLITGASGVVGREVAAALQGAARIIGLTHSGAGVPGLDEEIAVDLALPRFGLDDDTWNRLAGSVEVIVHSAALTRWGQDWPAYQAVNVDGTAKVVELAHAAGAPIHLISTAFVRVLELGGGDGLRSGNMVTPYITSKLMSERLVADSGLPYSIFRPTNLVGLSTTGASAEPQIVQALSDWYLRGKAPFFPIHPANRIDVTPLDLLTVPVATAVRQGIFGGPFWVTYGDKALTTAETLAVLGRHAEEIGRRIPTSPVVDAGQPLPVPLDAIPATSRAFLQVLLDVSEVTLGCGGVLPTHLDELTTRFGAPSVSPEEAYLRSLRYWSRERAATTSPELAGRA